MLLLTGACSQNDELPERTDTAAGQSLWLVDTTKMTGTNVRDVFPLVTQPVYTRAKDAPRHGLTEKAIVFQLDETVFIFPLWMMGVEMVNGNLNDTYFAVSYCPKTETTYVFNRQIDGKIHTFKASGVLYQDNLVYYDMETGKFPEVLTDKEGNTWNAFGVATDGPRKGEQLTGSVSYLGFWWAWEGIFESFNWVN